MNMVLPTLPNSISFLDIQNEFGGANPIMISEYYAGNGLTPAGVAIPNTGRISLQDFMGKSNTSNSFGTLSTTAKTACRALYSFKLLNSSYTGPVVKLRRGSDNVLQSFYANTAGALTTSAGTGTLLSTWLNGTTGYVEAWYDQSGKGNNVSQPTTSNQPALSVSGTEVCIHLTGNKYLSGGNVFSTSSITNMHMVFVSKEITRVDNYLLGLNGSAADGLDRCSVHAPWSNGTWYFDCGSDYTTNRSAGTSITSVGQKVVFSGYKSSAIGSSGFRINGGTRFPSLASTPATVSNGIILNMRYHDVTTQPNHHLYSVAVFDISLKDSVDETKMEAIL